MNFETDSVYGFIDDEYEAPVSEPKNVREPGWQSNRDDMTKPYVNQEQPRHVQEAMAITQEDRSYYAFGDLMFRRPARDAFTVSVNDKFLPHDASKNFKEERARYMKTYRKMMGEL